MLSDNLRNKHFFAIVNLSIDAYTEENKQHGSSFVIIFAEKLIAKSTLKLLMVNVSFQVCSINC